MQQRSEPQVKSNYYSLLELHPSASVIDIRRAYRELSKRYHPDTTELPDAVATAKFREINEAYATLTKPEQRFNYDLKIGYSRFGVIQPPPDLNKQVSRSYDWGKSAYLDATDRPLSGGELFALFIMGITLLGCLLLAIAIGIIRGDTTEQPFFQSIPQPLTQNTHLVSTPNFANNYGPIKDKIFNISY
ncbi:J domain-containing protein [Brunnivagina elsteri]|uniref:Molecular chaperone DnaJ n=1 Tax=Brunnivagina elsteri CCALA 953 TaxID=987040 RepID=A0A2A2TLV8_9CYAN|nr:J domain-containing protein [Calothrix elsteri]PAX58488.1 molecular chaperone DnaJ [Calothrix elsteri CCALA 953]